MKTLLVVIILLTINPLSNFGCTTFIIKTAQDLVFGRNLDWFSDNGIIVINKRNMRKASLVFPPEKPTNWTSKYGSITFNQFGREFPYGGINEKGLVIEIANADAQYETYDNRPAVNELQWIQYHLDNSASVEEVIAGQKFLRISPVIQELHFFICDSSGNAAIIEFSNHRQVIYKDENLPIFVMENDLYEISLHNLKNNLECRFVTASKMINDYNPEKNGSLIDYSFDILDEVALSGEWSVVYDIKNREIHFKTSSNPKLRKITLSAFNFSCKTETLIYDLLADKSGNINNDFIPFDKKINEEKMQDALTLNSIVLPKKMISDFYKYHKTCKCTE